MLSAGVIEVKRSQRIIPALHAAEQASVLQMIGNEIFKDTHEAAACQRGLNHHDLVVQDYWPLDGYGDTFSALYEFPGNKAAAWQPVANAGVLKKLIRLLGHGTPAEIERRSNDG